MTSFYFLFIIIAISMQVECFNYADNGPDTWFVDSPRCGNGLTQSPINIQDWNAKYDNKLGLFEYNNYDKVLRWSVSHDDRTIYFRPSITETDRLTFRTSSINKNDLFTCLQFHFHWGENDYQGSEHLIDNIKYPLEIHFVHQSSSGSYAVLGYLFKLDANDNPRLSNVIAAVGQVYNSTFTAQVSLKMSDFIPLNVRQGDYYRYDGSLTTPPCTEGITWTLFETAIAISEDQLDSFHDNGAEKNFREPQLLYSRDVTSTRNKRREDPEFQAIKNARKNKNN